MNNSTFISTIILMGCIPAGQGLFVLPYRKHPTLLIAGEDEILLYNTEYGYNTCQETINILMEILDD